MTVGLTRERVLHLYLEEGLSLSEIGALLGCSGKTVGLFLDKHGIPRRSRSGEVKPGVTWEMIRAGKEAEQDLIRRGIMLPS